MDHQREALTTQKVKASMGMRVIRANGEIEDHGIQFHKTVEVDYPTAVEMFGQEQADELFKGIDVKGVVGNGT